MPRTSAEHPLTATSRTVARVAAVLLSCAATLSLAAGCTSGGDEGTGVPTGSEIATLLTDHARAVRDRDRDAFLEGVGGGSFATKQAQVFGNLAQLPIAAWTYARDAAVDPGAQREVRARRKDPTALVVRVRFGYRLARADRDAAEHILYWTLARRDGRVVIVADTDLAAAGGSTWRGPWDYGPLTVVRGTGSLVLAHTRDADLANGLSAATDSAVSGVTDVVGTDWTRYVVVLVPATRDERDAFIGGAARTTANLAAAAVAEQDPDRLDRLVVDPDQLRRITGAGAQVLLRHEVTHVAEGGRETATVPRWLAEGFADYVGYLDTDRPVPQIAQELAARLRRSPVPSTLPANAEFDAAATGASSYQLSWLACRMLARRYGQPALVRFYTAVADGIPDTAVPTALRQVFGLTDAQFVAAWRAYVRSAFA